MVVGLRKALRILQLYAQKGRATKSLNPKV